MKKFTKIVLIIAAVFAITGFGFVIAGSVTAGGMGVLREQLRSGELNFDNWHFEDGVYYHKDGTNHHEKVKVGLSGIVKESSNLLPIGTEQIEEIFSKEVKRIEVDTDLGSITVKQTNDDKLKVSLYDGYTKYYSAKENGDTLSISYDVSGHTFKQGPKIIVELPKHMELEVLYVDTDLGEVILQDLEESLQMIEVYSDLGNVQIEDCKTHEVSTLIVNAALGNIVIEDSKFKEADLNAALGNVEFSGKVTGDMTVQADMGNIEVELDGKEKDYNIRMEADMGDVIYNRVKQKGDFNLQQEEAGGDIVLSCDIGNVELEFE